jgi:hypothetical protein
MGLVFLETRPLYNTRLASFLPFSFALLFQLVRQGVEPSLQIL